MSEQGNPEDGAAESPKVLLDARGIDVAFGRTQVLKDLTLDVYQGEILGFVGASGAGKSVLLRTILGLNKKQAGTIRVFDVDLDKANDAERMQVDMRIGVLFQHGALFSALTVKENIQIPMREYLDLPQKLMDELAKLKIELVGLAPDAADKYPSELSGGMIKRAALARALIMDPPLLLLDEPTAGLDPDSSDGFVRLLRSLHRDLELTVVMVTHDLDTLFELSTRIAVLADQRVIVCGSPKEVIAFQHPFIHDFFLGERGQRAMELLREYPFAI
jgi:phospholipid/cholesterol/gamma-HCH transport system ATP-binding protein